MQNKRKVDRRHSFAVVVLTTVALLPGCGNAAAPSLSTTAPTSPGITAVDEFRVSGTVTDTAYRPLSGVRVEVADGPKPGTVATTDQSGRFSMPGAFTGRITVVASKEGYLQDSRTIPLGPPRSAPPAGGNWELAFYLEPVGPAPSIEGDYTLTLTADTACKNIPADARSRTYTATIAPLFGSRTRFRATLSGAGFVSTHDSALISTAGDFATFTVCDSDPSQSYCLPGILEEIRVTNYLAIEGEGGATFDAAGMTMRFHGSFEYCPGEVVLTRDQYQCLATGPVQCESDDHTLTLVRRNRIGS